jgi:diamine N-acetyltransferase
MALTCLLNYCFKTLQLHQLYCNIISSNTESIELFKKQGFSLMGVRKDWILTQSGFVDVQMFQLIDKDFKVIP